MITAIVLHLTAQTDGRITGGTGRAVHGFWLNQWRQVAPHVAGSLHQTGGIQPFTLSPLMELPAPHRGQTTIAAGQKTWLRIAVLTPSLSQQLLETWLPRLPAQIELAGIPWNIQRLCLTPAEHPWARQDRYANLLNRHLTASRPPQKWRLQFITPTTFHGSHNNHLPFPLPDALIASWARRWQAFSPVPLPWPGQPEESRAINEAIKPRIRSAVRVSAYNLKTRPVRYGRRLTIGCVGQMTLNAATLSREELALVNLLAGYACYCGSGHRTTQGMGLTRLHQEQP